MISVPLRWRDSDHLGHVYHGTTVALLDEARSRWMESLGLDDVVNYVIVHLDVTFKSEILVADRVVSFVAGVERVGRSSITTSEVLTTERTGVCIEARCTMVHWDGDVRASVAIRDEDRETLLRLPATGATLSQA